MKMLQLILIKKALRLQKIVIRLNKLLKKCEDGKF